MQHLDYGGLTEAPRFEKSLLPYLPFIMESSNVEAFTGEDNEETEWTPSCSSSSPPKLTNHAARATSNLLRLLSCLPYNDENFDPQLTFFGGQLTPLELSRVCFVAWKDLVHCGPQDRFESSGRHLIRRLKIMAESQATDKALSKHHIMHKASTYLFTFLFHMCKNRVREAFGVWNRVFKSARRALARFFYQWEDLAKRRKLNKMKFTRLMPLLPSLCAAAECRLKERAVELWKEGISHRQTMRHAKLLFTCWRTATRSCKKGRVLRIRLAFREWHQRAQETKSVGRMAFARHFFRRLGRPVERRRGLAKAALLGLSLLPLRQAMFGWLISLGQGSTGSVALHKRAVSMLESVRRPVQQLPISSLSSPSGVTTRSPRSSIAESPRRASNVFSAASPRTPVSSSSKVIGVNNQSASIGPSLAQYRAAHSAVQQQQTPASGGRVRSRQATPSASAWNHELSNISNLSAAKFDKSATVENVGIGKMRYVSSRSLLQSPDREKRRVVTAATRMRPQTAPAPPSTKPHAKIKSTSKPLLPSVKALMADPLARIQIRLAGLKALGAVEIAPRNEP